MRKRVLVPVVLVVTLLASCASFMALHEFEGAASIDGEAHTLLFRFTSYGQLVRGSYYLDGAEDASGLAEGTISGSDLVLTLTEGDCEFDFVGSVTTSSLDGTYMPRTDGCGSGGTWSLQATGGTALPARTANVASGPGPR